MELDATTFVLEIVNFLALLWLLTRFLYRPIQAALGARAKATAEQIRQIESRSADLDSRTAEVERLRAELDLRREAADRELAAEIAAIRHQRLGELTRDVLAEREKAQARMEQELDGAREQIESRLRERAAHFVGGYLKRLASASTEASVVELFLADLAAQTNLARRALRDGSMPIDSGVPAVEVSTAYPPAAALRERVESALSALIEEPARLEWRLEPDLLAGICVRVAGHQLETSLRRGFDAFAAAP